MKIRSRFFQNTDEFIIKPPKGFVSLNIRELWQYRELLFVFTWRDIKIRYKQTVLGILWAFIPPILSMVIFTLIFENLIDTPSNIPYPLFVYSGTLLWMYFSTSLTFSSNSLVGHQGMIQKTYFPRIILPLSSVIAGLLDFTISFLILIFLMIVFQWFPTYMLGILLIPILLFITILSALGFGLIFSALNVKYRDIKYALPFFIQMGLFITPVIYPVDILGNWSFILWLNPMTSVIENTRSVLLGLGEINWNLLIFSLVISLVYFLIGIYYFRQVEKDFADII